MSASRRWQIAIAVAVAALAYDPSAPAAVAKRAVLLLLGIVGLALCTAAGARGDRPTLTRAGVPWLCCCGLLAASLAWGPHDGGAALSTPIASAALLMALAGVDRRALFALSAHAASLIAVGASMMAWWSWWGGARGIAFHGGMGNPNWLGMTLACALPLVLGRFAHASIEERWWLGFASLLSIITLAAAQSRVAWVALAIAAIVFAPGRARALAALPLAPLGFAAWFGDLGAAFAGRLWIWRASLNAAMEAPWLGHGAGGFPFAFLDAQGALLRALPLERAAAQFVNADSAHSDWLQLWAEAGIAAPLLLAAALALGIGELRHTWRGGAAALLVITICAIADTPLSLPPIITLMALVFAGTATLSTKRSDVVAIGAVAIAAAALMPRAANQWIADRRMFHAEDAPPAERIRALSHAAAQAPWDGTAALSLGIALHEGGDYERAAAELERSRLLLANVGTDVALGNAWLALGRHADAITAYRKAIARQPGSFRARLDLVEALRRSDDLDGAERELAIARQLQPHHPKLARLAETLRREVIDRATR